MENDQKAIKKTSILTPDLKPIKKNGSLYYCETDRARTIIRLGKSISNEFSDLQGKKPIKYTLEYYRDNKQFHKRVKKVVNENEGLPFLLFLVKEE